jgi:hypothetical protein
MHFALQYFTSDTKSCSPSCRQTLLAEINPLDATYF